MNRINRWHYDIVKGFHTDYFKHLLTENCVSDDELHIVNVKDRLGDDVEVSNFFYVLKKGPERFLVRSDYMKDLPILVDKFQKVSYRSKAYNLVEGYRSAKFRAEKLMSFRQMVDSFADYDHTEKADWKLARMLALMLVMDRNNIRMSSQPAFGKDSLFNVLSYLTGDVAKVDTPSMAKMEYLLFNKVLVLNEISGIDAADGMSMQKFLLDAGGFQNTYQKHTRAGGGSREEYNIDKLSLCILYNDMDCYKNEGKYFDNMFPNKKAVTERFIPFKMRGKIVEDFPKVLDLKKEIADNREYFISFIRSMMYYQRNLHKELHGFHLKTNINEEYGLTGRWGREFSVILPFIDLYAENEEEYKGIVNALYNRHVDYIKMIGSRDQTLESTYIVPKEETIGQQTLASSTVATEELLDGLSEDEKMVMKLIKEHVKEKGDGYDIEPLVKLVGEDVVDQMKHRTLIYEKKGRLFIL